MRVFVVCSPLLANFKKKRKISEQISLLNQQLRIQLIVNLALGMGEEGQSNIHTMTYNVSL